MSNTVITIGRTFGSGAREIGKKVAEALGIPFYDKELLEVAAKESGGEFYAEYLEFFDEKRAIGFLYSASFNPYVGEGIPLDIAIQSALEKAVKDAANQGSCVIIGRRADKILRDNFDILSVFVSASMEKRIDRVSKRDGLSEKDSKKKILRADRSRRAFYNSYGDGDWGEAANYDLCINSGRLGVDNSAAMILQYLKLEGKLL